MQLVIAEKASVGFALAKALGVRCKQKAETLSNEFPPLTLTPLVWVQSQNYFTGFLLPVMLSTSRAYTSVLGIAAVLKGISFPP